MTDRRVQRQWLYDLGCNLSSGLALALFRRLDSDRLRLSLGQLLTLVALLLALEFVLAFAQTDPPRAFNPYGIDFLAAFYLFELLLILIGSRLAGADNASFGRILLGMLSSALPVSLVMQGIGWVMLSGEPSLLLSWGYLALLLLWNLSIMLRLLNSLVGSGLRRRFAGAVLYTLGSLAGLWLIPRIDLWYTDYRERAPADNPVNGLDVESIYYAQPQMMDTGAAALEPQRPGVVDLYLLAFGGYGLEDVFLNEVEYVRHQFDSRYGTRGRSLILANNPETLSHYPLANGHNLRSGLNAIAEKMDRDEDLLFLFMTSHGSADHHFSVEMGPLRLVDLSAPELRQALDEAGIRWRVILVSSCYSGGFIEPLKTPETLVITAAASDRTSFGCGSQSDFTYFGTAYFKQALMQEPRFIEAFELAKEWVTAREREDDFTPSEPQRFVGDAIADKLEQYYLNVVALRPSDRAEPSLCKKGSAPTACR